MHAHGGASAARKSGAMIAALGAVLLLQVPELRAGEELATALLSQGIERFSNAAFDEAREALQRALSLARTAELRGRTLLYLGLVAAAQNQDQAARQHFRRALLADASLTIDPRRHKRAFVEMFAAVRATLLGELVVTTRASGAVVHVDGRSIGQGREVRRSLVAGSHDVEVRTADDAVLLARRIEVRPTRTTHVIVPGPPPRRPARRERTARPRRRSFGWAWAAGAGVATMAVAIGLGLSALSDHDEACGLLAEPSLPCGARQYLLDPADRGRYEQLERAMSRKRLASGIAWGTTAALAVGAATLLLLRGRPARARERRGAVHLAPVVGEVNGLRVGLAY